MQRFLIGSGLFLISLLFLGPVPHVKAATEFGVVGAVPSFSTDSLRQAAVDKISEAGFGWTRHEFDYNNPMNFSTYDSAQDKLDAKGIKTLGLLLFTGTDRTHDDWKNYVSQIVSHYGTRIPAWEIMNEADNYLSAADYVTYLKEAHDIIKGINPNATIVLSGITSRPETPNFWSGVAAAGGWNYFDVAGLHVYHSGNPEKVNFGGGDLLAEYDRAIASLNKNGGGKKIWITETGYNAGEISSSDQADWLARELIMTRSVSTIEKIFIYRLSDDSRANYGLLTSSLAERPAYGAIKTAIAQLGGAGNGTRLYPQSKTTLDSMESTSGWSAKATSNGTTTLTTATGKSGNALKINYSFTADKAYAVAEKSIAAGQPQAFAAWFYGDDTKNVWKYRFKDAKGETFQADLGNISSGWSYKQFTIGQDTAYVSWDGDGVIDYPISFNSIVVDRQGGEANASGLVDELVAITGGADLFAFQFGDKVAYWKVSGTATADLCGASRNFSQSPAYASGVNCADTPKTSTSTAPSAAAATTTSSLSVDKNTSWVRVDGQNIPANGTDSYRIVIFAKDTNGNVMKSTRPTLVLSKASTTVSIGRPTLVGDEWWSTVTSTAAGDYTIIVKIGTVELKRVTSSFGAVLSPSPSPLPSPSPSPSPTLNPSPTPIVRKVPTKKARPVGLIIALVAVAGVGAGGAGWWFYRKRRASH